MRPIGRDKRDTNRIGEVSEAAIITRFLQLGYVILTPYGGNQRYDVVIEDITDSSGAFSAKQPELMKVDQYLGLILQ